MVKRIFKTKIIYYINIAFNIIYFLLVVDELKFLLDGKLPSEDSKYKILMTMIYVLYFLIYSFNLIILFSKFKKSIFYLNFSFILLIFPVGVHSIIKPACLSSTKLPIAS